MYTALAKSNCRFSQIYNRIENFCESDMKTIHPGLPGP